jgi:hypothetical protein
MLRNEFANELRYRQLKAMDKTLRECVNDENHFMSWLMIGIPDGSTDADFKDYASDAEEFMEFLNLFTNLVNRLDSDPNEMSKEEIVNKFISNL